MRIAGGERDSAGLALSCPARSAFESRGKLRRHDTASYWFRPSVTRQFGSKKDCSRKLSGSLARISTVGLSPLGKSEVKPFETFTKLLARKGPVPDWRRGEKLEGAVLSKRLPHATVSRRNLICPDDYNYLMTDEGVPRKPYKSDGGASIVSVFFKRENSYTEVDGSKGGHR